MTDRKPVITVGITVMVSCNLRSGVPIFFRGRKEPSRRENKGKPDRRLGFMFLRIACFPTQFSNGCSGCKSFICTNFPIIYHIKFIKYLISIFTCECSKSFPSQGEILSLCTLAWFLQLQCTSTVRQMQDSWNYKMAYIFTRINDTNLKNGK